MLTCFDGQSLCATLAQVVRLEAKRLRIRINARLQACESHNYIPRLFERLALIELVSILSPKPLGQVRIRIGRKLGYCLLDRLRMGSKVRRVTVGQRMCGCQGAQVVEVKLGTSPAHRACAQICGREPSKIQTRFLKSTKTISIVIKTRANSVNNRGSNLHPWSLKPIAVRGAPQPERF